MANVIPRIVPSMPLWQQQVLFFQALCWLLASRTSMAQIARESSWQTHTYDEPSVGLFQTRSHGYA